MKEYGGLMYLAVARSTCRSKKEASLNNFMFVLESVYCNF